MQILEISFLSNNMQHPHTLTSAAEIWKNATTKAAARKATAEGVRSCAAVIQPGGKWFIYQISGSTSERGLFSDYLNPNGQRTNRSGAPITEQHSRRTTSPAERRNDETRRNTHREP